MTVELAVPAAGGGTGLLLRPWEAADARAVALAHEDAALRRWLTHTVDGEQDALRWIGAQGEGWSSGLRYSFAVVEAPGAPPVGHVVVKRKAPGTASAEVGYWTAPAARGRGVAPRAVAAVTRWALAGEYDGGLARLELLHAVDNSASCRVAAKCGYALHARLDPHPPKFPTAGHVHVYGGQGPGADG